MKNLSAPCEKNWLPSFSSPPLGEITERESRRRKAFFRSLLGVSESATSLLVALVPWGFAPPWKTPRPLGSSYFSRPHRGRCSHLSQLEDTGDNVTDQPLLG